MRASFNLIDVICLGVDKLTFEGRVGDFENIILQAFLYQKIIHAHDHCRKKFTHVQWVETNACYVENKNIMHLNVPKKISSS